MTRDTSLDEFVGAGGSAESDDAGGEATATDGDAAADDATAEDAVEPAVVTYDVSPDGAECAACGETVTRRWRDDPGMVCGECKEW